MKVILLHDIPNVGRKYEVKDVADGYASNMLIPNGLAERATKGKVKYVRERNLQIEEERKLQTDLLSKNLESLKNVSVQITAKANEKGHLFQGIHKEDIVTALRKQAHIDLPPDLIQIDHPIKEAGDHNIVVSSNGETSFFVLSISNLG